MQQMNKPYEGLFVSIEGGDGCGKTTLAKELAEALEKKGYRVLRTREPGGPPLAEHLRSLLLNPPERYKICEKAELLLFLAARAQHFEENIKPALYKGEIVLCERFHDSTIAYQGCGRGLGMEFVEKLCALVLDGPDFTLLLDIDPQLGLERQKEEGKERDRIEQQLLQFHRLVRQAYLHLADAHANRIAVLDAALSKEEILVHALEELEPHLMLSKR